MRGWSPQEIEFTFEGSSAGQIYLLQSRDMAIRESEKVALFDPEGLKPDKYLAHGIGVSGGAMTGRLVFSIEEIEKWRTEPERHLILPAMIQHLTTFGKIFAADGLLTARGGLTSHALSWPIGWVKPAWWDARTWYAMKKESAACFETPYCFPEMR